jgi:hypothetical protein
MKTFQGSGGIAPHILDLGTRWRRVVSFTLRPLYPQVKSPRYPLGGWVDPRGGLNTVVKRKIPSPRRDSNPDHPIVQPSQSVYRLSYPDEHVISNLIEILKAV